MTFCLHLGLVLRKSEKSFEPVCVEAFDLLLTTRRSMLQMEMLNIRINLYFANGTLLKISSEDRGKIPVQQSMKVFDKLIASLGLHQSEREGIKIFISNSFSPNGDKRGSRDRDNNTSGARRRWP
jgi:hypothetical protein